MKNFFTKCHFPDFFMCIMYLLGVGSCGNVRASPHEDLVPCWAFGVSGCATPRSDRPQLDGNRATSSRSQEFR